MKLVSKLALAAALAVPSFTMAEDGPNTGGITFSGGVDVVSSYYFRGYLNENSGLIIQPYLGAAVNIVDGDDFKIGLSLSTWNSIHTVHGEGSAEIPSDGGGAGAWYENDIYVSLPISFGDFTVTPSYYLYQYPGGALETVQEALITVGYDDKAIWKDMVEGFKLNPWITLAYELDDGNGSEDTYLELGLKPTYTFKAGDMSVPLSFPIVLGMSLDDYYVDSDGDNAVFGYAQVGVETSFALTSGKYGTWSLNLGGYYQYLIADSAEAANHDESNVFWGKAGVSFSY
jgi:hypothetical protein